MPSVCALAILSMPLVWALPASALSLAASAWVLAMVACCAACLTGSGCDSMPISFFFSRDRQARGLDDHRRRYRHVVLAQAHQQIEDVAHDVLGVAALVDLDFDVDIAEHVNQGWQTVFVEADTVDLQELRNLRIIGDPQHALRGPVGLRRHPRHPVALQLPDPEILQEWTELRQARLLQHVGGAAGDVLAELLDQLLVGAEAVDFVLGVLVIFGLLQEFLIRLNDLQIILVAAVHQRPIWSSCFSTGDFHIVDAAFLDLELARVHDVDGFGAMLVHRVLRPAQPADKAVMVAVDIDHVGEGVVLRDRHAAFVPERAFATHDLDIAGVQAPVPDACRLVPVIDQANAVAAVDPEVLAVGIERGPVTAVAIEGVLDLVAAPGANCSSSSMSTHL